MNADTGESLGSNGGQEPAMGLTLPESDWVAVWEAAGAGAPPVGGYQFIMAAYTEGHRHYHNQQHLAECLREWTLGRHLSAWPALVELALWFHDAVYDPTASDNEESSADLARDWCEAAGLSVSVAATVSRLVMATKSHLPEGDPDASLVVDVDLSILGRDPKRFAEYEAGIRQEYGWVSEEVFSVKRAAILRGFLARDFIFANSWFRQRYESQARTNLSDSLRRLKKA